MALLKTISFGVKPSPSAKATISSSTAKKPVDTGSLKIPAPLSAIKTKSISAPMKSPTKSPINTEKTPVEGEKSPEVEKRLKTVVTKSSVGPATKTRISAMKNPITKSTTVETRISVRNVIKSAPKTPEPKLSNSKIGIIVPSTPEKVTGVRTNMNSASGLKISPTSSVKSSSSAVKSISSPMKSSVSFPVKSSSSAKLVSSPAKSISSPCKAVSFSGKSVSPVKSVSSPVRLGLPVKSISSSIKSKLASTETSKDTKTKAATGLIKKPVLSVKSSIKTTTSPISTKLKLSPSKVSKAGSPVTKIIAKPFTAKTVSVGVTSISAVKTPDPCHCTDPTEKCEDLSNTPLITGYAVDNESFDVVQAFKVAEQLIKIQSNDRNLEPIIQTYENTSIVNWDDVIIPCDDFVPNSNLKQTNFDVSTCTPQKEILKHDSCIIELTDLNIRSSDTSTTEPQNELHFEHRDENRNIFEITESSSCSDSSSIQNYDEKFFSDEVLSTNICDELIKTETNDFTQEILPNCTDQIRNDKENVLPEWTITIDEFSLELSSKEKQSLIVTEKENLMVDKTACSVSMSYADVLKKLPNVLLNSTNVQYRKMEPKLNLNLNMKQYQVLKKVEGLYATTVFFNNIENNHQDCDDNYYFEEPEYSEIRKKKCKKIKHLSKRHLRNINREPESIENHPDVFVTSVWKNIY